MNIIKSPRDRYLSEVKGGGLNIVSKQAKYFKDKYLKETYATNSIRELKIGQIYTYRYDPKYKDVLDYYDTNPLTLVYNAWYSKSGTFLYTGINLHFLPVEVKLQVIELYWKYFYRFGGTKLAKVLPYTYSKFFKTILKQMNKIDYVFAIRTYIVDRITTPIEVPETDWGKIPLWKPTFINGKTLDDIYNEYYTKQNRK